MDLDHEELKARVEALEIALKVITENKPELLPDLQRAFQRAFDDADRLASRSNTIDMSVVRVQPPPARHPEIEKVRVDVFRGFARKYGADA